MDDLISRHAVIDKLKREKKILYSPVGAEYLIKAIEDLPSAQTEIIRCKDCKHRYVDGENVRFNVCELNHNKVQSDDWFCADAERKEGEADD